MNKYFRELIMWFFILVPYAYLAYLWNYLPDQVPIHFNLEGNADNWASKTSLLILPGAICLGTYFLMLLIPVVDPKNKILQMGIKYFSLRLIMTIFTSVLSIYLLKTTRDGVLSNPSILVALIGAFDLFFGNYLQTVKPNYFLGIRTPWTLENETIWRSTNRLAGKLWVAGGVLIILLAFSLKSNLAIAIALLSLTFIMVVIPVIYSYLQFKKIKI